MWNAFSFPNHLRSKCISNLVIFRRQTLLWNTFDLRCSSFKEIFARNSRIVMFLRYKDPLSLWIGFGDNTDLLWWNNVNNQFCQLTTRVSYQRGIRRPFKCTGNHTYWGLKNKWGVQSKKWSSKFAKSMMIKVAGWYDPLSSSCICINYTVKSLI